MPAPGCSTRSAPHRTVDEEEKGRATMRVSAEAPFVLCDLWWNPAVEAQAIADVPGEEGFARGLTQTDLEYLFAEDGAERGLAVRSHGIRARVLEDATRLARPKPLRTASPCSVPLHTYCRGGGLDFGRLSVFCRRGAVRSRKTAQQVPTTACAAGRTCSQLAQAR